jgi:nucleotide-binding universal stress UspA family protein
MKVLIGVDGSDGSHDAVRQATALLSAERDQVALYYSPPHVRFHEAPASEADMQDRVRQALSQAVFEDARRWMPEPLRAAAHTIVGTQAPRHGLLVAADAWRADLVALGARGGGPIAAMPLGSTAQSIARAATIPVLITRPRPADGAGSVDGAGSAWRVLLASDGSPASRRAGEAIAHAAWPPDTVGMVMTVVEAMMPGEIPEWLQQRARDADSEAMAQAWTREHEAEIEAKRRELAVYCATLPEPFRAHPPIVAEGHAADRILAAIAEHRVNLVVVGAQGVSAWKRLLMGSTSETVLSQAPCSVLVAPEHERA